MSFTANEVGNIMHNTSFAMSELTVEEEKA